MADVTPVYGFPYQELGDAPDGPQLGEDLALAVEGVITRMDTACKITVYSSGSGTWTKNVSPAPKWVEVELWGGGASGSAAGGGAGQAAGGGGGGGAYCRKLYAATALSATEAYAVGAGGSGNAGAGNAGVVSTFKTLTAGGGTNGLSMATATGNSLASNGLGGTATNGDINRAGSDGGKGQVNAGIALFTNTGGSAPCGGGQSTFTGSVQAVGTAGKFPGGGASGSFAGGTGQNGASGASGCIIVREYF